MGLKAVGAAFPGADNYEGVIGYYHNASVDRGRSVTAPLSATELPELSITATVNDATQTFSLASKAAFERRRAGRRLQRVTVETNGNTVRYGPHELARLRSVRSVRDELWVVTRQWLE